MRKYAPLILICIGILTGFLLLELYQESEPAASGAKPPISGQPEDPTSSQPPKERPPRLAQFPKTITLLPVASSTSSLHSEGLTVHDDLSLIHSMLREYRRALGANPVGFNDEIIAALTGKNHKGAACLPKDHPAISTKGELLDRWQTPYRFHAYSAKHMEIRSAGPDRTFFTSDDTTLRE